MPALESLLIAAALAGGVVSSPVAGPGASVDFGTQQPLLNPHASQPPSRSLRGRFLHITDFHPDDFYKIHSSTEEGIACHRGKGLAGSYGAERTDCDSPFSLVNATFDWLEAHVKDKVDFVVWTGDTARHDSDEKHPRTTPEVLDTNRRVAKKFIETFNSKDGKLAIPVVPTFGNNDFLPHNIFYPGPNKWLHAYGDIWKRFIPEEQYHSFAYGGWFYVDVIPKKLAVFSLNTMYFFDRNAGVDGCAKPSEPGYQHMEWLRVQLQRMRESGMKAILIGHVPPARTNSKWNWDETCWQKYTLWLKQYRDVVTGAVYGHMNIDHFLLQDTHDIILAKADGLESEDATEDATEEESEDSTEDDSEGYLPEDELSIQSKSDYLQELRSAWSSLPGSVIQSLGLDEGDEDMGIFGKGRKGGKGGKGGKGKDNYKKIGGKYAERYQVSLVSPSIVPNYFPTIRIIEYNITGLGQAALWTDSFDTSTSDALAEVSDFPEPHEELKRSAVDATGKKGRKGRKGNKGNKGHTPKDPNLIVPDDPPKSSLPGPAYFPQPFTFTGYTQYFANLTHLNNDITHAMRWRDGDHAEDLPDHKPKPRGFKFEVEYSTFDDKIFKLSDLTVKSYVKLAYRIGKVEKKKRMGKGNDKTDPKGMDELDEQDDLDIFGDDDEDFIESNDDEYDEDDDDHEIEEDTSEDADSSEEETIDATGKKSKKKHRKHKKNKVWLHFLRHAFVNTATEKELKKMSR